MNDTRKFLEFIIEQKLDLKDYDKLKPMVDKKFNISMNGEHGFHHIIDCVVSWKNGNQFASLESTLNQFYRIKSK